ncbi:hypothetical protein Tco_0514382 [Tanacetum coccineum]
MPKDETSTRNVVAFTFEFGNIEMSTVKEEAPTGPKSPISPKSQCGEVYFDFGDMGDLGPVEASTTTSFFHD